MKSLAEYADSRRRVVRPRLSFLLLIKDSGDLLSGKRAAARFFIRPEREMKLSLETTGEIRAIAEEKGCRLLAVESAGAGRFSVLRLVLERSTGEPVTLEDCETVCKLVRVTPGISLHIPWDKPENPAELRAFAESRGLFVDSMNSNTE